MSDLISRQEIDKKLIGLWDLAWGYDIPSPTIPEYVELHEAISAIMNAIKEVRREIDEQPSAEPLTDVEQRIFLKAISREEEVCRKVDAERGEGDEECEINLVHVCHKIVRKVKGALWT